MAVCISDWASGSIQLAQLVGPLPAEVGTIAGKVEEAAKQTRQLKEQAAKNPKMAGQLQQAISNVSLLGGSLNAKQVHTVQMAGRGDNKDPNVNDLSAAVVQAAQPMTPSASFPKVPISPISASADTQVPSWALSLA